jgi:hypothetical protein
VDRRPRCWPPVCGPGADVRLPVPHGLVGQRRLEGLLRPPARARGASGWTVPWEMPRAATALRKPSRGPAGTRSPRPGVGVGLAGNRRGWLFHYDECCSVPGLHLGDQKIIPLGQSAWQYLFDRFLRGLWVCGGPVGGCHSRGGCVVFWVVRGVRAALLGVRAAGSGAGVKGCVVGTMGAVGCCVAGWVFLAGGAWCGGSRWF